MTNSSARHFALNSVLARLDLHRVNCTIRKAFVRERVLQTKTRSMEKDKGYRITSFEMEREAEFIIEHD